MQEEYANDIVSEIKPLTPGEELSEVIKSLQKSKVKSVSIYERIPKSKWKLSTRIRKCKDDKPKRRRKRKAAKMARRHNR